MGNKSSKKLLKYDYLDWPFFSLSGHVRKGKIVKVYDGDTCTAIVHLPKFGYVKIRIRLEGINAPELRTKDLEVKEKAILSRDALKKMILGKVVKLSCNEFDCFGRVLAEIYINKQSVNQLMITNQHAIPFKKSR